MNTPFLYAASTVSALTALAHIFIGGTKNATPVLTAPGLPIGPRVTVEFAWQAASVFMLFAALIYLWAAVRQSGYSLVAFTTIHCASLAILGIVTAYRGGINPWSFPPFLFFTLIAMLGGLALWR